MKKKNKICILIITILLIGFFAIGTSLAESEDKCDELGFQIGLINDLASHNIGYLTISVTIILVFVILINIFNFGPLRKKIDDQEQKVEELRRKNEERFLELTQNQDKSFKSLKTTIEGRLNSMIVETWNRLDDLEATIENKNKKLENQIKGELKTEIEKLRTATHIFVKKANDKIEDLELRTIWYRHYMWEERGVFINVLSTLCEYLEKGIKYNKTSLFEMCLKNVNGILEKIELTSYSAYYHDRLVKILGEIEGFEKEKDEIIKKATALFEKKSEEKE